MQVTLIGKVEIVAGEGWKLPKCYEINTIRENDWLELAALYLKAYPREIVEDLATAEEEMRLTQKGEYVPLKPELSPVVKMDGKAVGVIMTVAQAPWPESPDGLLIIEVITHPDHRRRGIAQAGLAWLAAEAEKQGYRTLALRVETENTGAVALYRKLAFDYYRNRMIHLIDWLNGWKNAKT